jgi:cytochrome c-type biogenesis protein CcmH/NrfG
MTEQEQQLPTQARAALERCLSQLRFARATELAQSNRFLEAQAELVRNGEDPCAPRELDLLARIATRQGRVSDAHRFWDLALQKDPRNPDYEECLQRLGDLPRIRLSFETVIECLVWAANAFGIATLLYALLSRQ